MTLSELVTLTHARPIGQGQFRTLCPVHGDKHASLDLREGCDGRILLICRSQGCKVEAICAAWGIEVVSLYPRPLTQAERAQFDVRRQQQQQQQEHRAWVERRLAARERILYRLAAALSCRLVHGRDEAQATRMARLWHLALDQAREAKAQWHRLHHQPELYDPRFYAELDDPPECSKKKPAANGLRERTQLNDHAQHSRHLAASRIQSVV